MTVTESHGSSAVWAPAYEVDDWRDRAVCKGLSHAFFDEPEDAAKNICALCPVVAPCLDDALTRNDPWVLGGMTYYQRKRERARRNTSKTWVCPTCREPFVPVPSGHKQIYCSDRCRWAS